MKRVRLPLMQKEPHLTNRFGFSSVEALLAAAIFALLATALVGAFLYGQEATALAGSRARATFLAEEGLEAARNIRDAGFSNLTDGTFGVTTASNQWNLSGASDVTDVFTREVVVSTIDAKTKELTSTVTWQQNSQRTGTVSIVTRLSNWIASVTTSATGGLFLYGDGTTTPKSRTYDQVADTFGTETPTLLGASGNAFVLRTSPTKTEAIGGYLTTTGVLQIMCFDGTDWTNEWTATVGGTATTRRFDIAYETNSGDVMVLYGRNAPTTNELGYRTKLGSSGCGTGNWSAATNLDPVRTAGRVHWVKMAWDKRPAENLIVAAWADDQSDLSSMIWDGSTWANEPSAASATTLDIISAAQDIESFDVEYESVSGDVLLVWGLTVGSNANGVRYRVCTNGTGLCAWGAVTTPPTWTDDAPSLDISANPDTDQMVFASVGTNQNDLQIGYWSGSAWTNTANADTSCNPPVSGSRRTQTGWLVSGATTRSLIAYGDQGSNAIDWYTGNVGVFTKQTDFVPVPAPNNPNNSLDIQMDPLNKNQLMYTFGDSSGQLFAKRLSMSAAPVFTWTNSDAAVLVGTLPQTITNPFSFAYWRQ